MLENKCISEIAGLAVFGKLAKGPSADWLAAWTSGRCHVRPALGDAGFRPAVNVQSPPRQRGHANNEARAWQACYKPVAVFEHDHRIQQHTNPIYGYVTHSEALAASVASFSCFLSTWV